MKSYQETLNSGNNYEVIKFNLNAKFKKRNFASAKLRIHTALLFFSKLFLEIRKMTFWKLSRKKDAIK